LHKNNFHYLYSGIELLGYSRRGEMIHVAWPMGGGYFWNNVSGKTLIGTQVFGNARCEDGAWSGVVVKALRY